MLSGFWFGVCAAFLWSIVNVIDKYLVERFTKHTGIGGILILSSLFSIVLLPVTFFLGAEPFTIQTTQIFILLFIGSLSTVWIYFYLTALNDNDVSRVVALFQLTPIFTFILAFFLLKELPTSDQIFYALLIIIGAFILVYEHSTSKFKLKLAIQMILSTIFIALINVMYKYVAVDIDFWTTIFWTASGTTLAGGFLYISIKKYRIEFNNFIHSNFGIGIALNSINESLTLAGDVIFLFALTLSPAALVQTTGAYQPLFVFILGTILAISFPKLSNEDIHVKLLLQKALGIFIIVMGSILMFT